MTSPTEARTTRAFIAGGIAAALGQQMRELSPEPDQVRVEPIVAGEDDIRGLTLSLASGLVFDIVITERA